MLMPKESASWNLWCVQKRQVNLYAKVAWGVLGT